MSRIVACCAAGDRRYAFTMLRPPKPFTPEDNQLLETFTAVWACGHSRELFARRIQAQLGIGVLVDKVRESAVPQMPRQGRPGITVTRLPR